MPCWPSWYAKYAALAASAEGKKVVASGCSTSGGNVQCDPAEMAKRAGVPLDVYTLARYVQSEVGTSHVAETVAVGEAAVNRSKGNVNALLLYRQNPGHPNRGFYGPIHGGGGVESAPYGRWAATSKDPTVAALAIAQLIMSGGSHNFAQGADDQNGMQYAKAFADPEATIRRQAGEGDYWVGPLPGVDPWRTFLMHNYGKHISGVQHDALLTRGLIWAKARRRVGDLWVADPPVTWDPNMPTCSALSELSGGQIIGIALLGSAAIGAAFVGVKRYLTR